MHKKILVRAPKMKQPLRMYSRRPENKKKMHQRNTMWHRNQSFLPFTSNWAFQLYICRVPLRTFSSTFFFFQFYLIYPEATGEGMLYIIYATPCNTSKSMSISTIKWHRIKELFMFDCTTNLTEMLAGSSPIYLTMSVLRQVAKYEGTKPQVGIDATEYKNGRIIS